MTAEFKAVVDPAEDALRDVERLNPTNPFCSVAYAEAQRSLGAGLCVLQLCSGERVDVACLAYLRKGRLNRSLELTSTPVVGEHADVFWDGVVAFCKEEHIHVLSLETYASIGADVPRLPGETKRSLRREYVLDLADEDLRSKLHKGHRYRVGKAQRTGVVTRCCSDAEAFANHEKVVLSSRSRLAARGDSVPADLSLVRHRALVSSGAAVFFQAFLKDEPVSSILVLLAPKGAYPDSSGTNEEGRKCGAGHYLRHELSLWLQRQGKEVFFMGGNDMTHPGLDAYKSGFGCWTDEIEAAQFYLGGALRKKVTTVIDLIRSNPRRLLAAVVGTIDRSVVYAARVQDVPVPEPMDHVQMRKLSDDEVAQLPSEHPELREYSRRLRGKGFNDAYGIFLKEKLAHVAWMITAEHDALLPYRGVKLWPHEVEITHCVTQSEFRRRGLYLYAIRRLCELAAAKGSTKVYMAANVTNVASQKGIEAAGLERQGLLLRYRHRCLPEKLVLVFRGHRWRLGD